MDLRARFEEAVAESIRLKSQFLTEQAEVVVAAAQMIAAVLRAGWKVLIFGNGGSAADAQHLAAEFVNRFQVERPPLAALALNTDTSILTSIANDYDFQEVFAKQVRALGRPGDLAWGISTSGASANVVQGLKAARELGLKTLALSGRDGGEVAAQADIALIVRSRATPRIQEVHITIGHVLCDLVDCLLFPEKFAKEGSG
ncbi:MAG: D-sedoheptulose 7-phosphate isomerase [Desulfobaccales bacterium]|nr:D-sedoheptulose 7-phosphate isomerase [Desulfobaccales bacterium]